MAKKKKQHEAGWRCPECKKVRKKDGFDPCLGELPGVIFACCGHGGLGYIYFSNGKIIRFDGLTQVEDTEPHRLQESMQMSEYQNWLRRNGHT
jgi:hypothetical protein